MGSEFKKVNKTKAAALKRQTVVTPRDREIGESLIDLEGRRKAKESALRTIEITGLPDSDGTFVLRHNFASLRKRKDDDEFLVGTEGIDTLRTQLDINIKHEAARNLSSPFFLEAEENIIYGIDSNERINLLPETRRFGVTTGIDGFKAELDDLTPSVVTDIRDIEKYGRREYRTKVTVNDEAATNYGKYHGVYTIPEGVYILSGTLKNTATVAPFGSTTSFEVFYQKHNSDLASVGIKSRDAQLFRSQEDRKKPFALNILVDATTNIPTFHFNSPQVDSNNVDTFTTSTNIPTNLVREVKRSFITEVTAGFNWSGKTADLIGIAAPSRDVRTLAVSGSSVLAYSALKESTAFTETHLTDGPFDRAAVTRVEDTDDTAHYSVVDQSIFRDRTDIETEQFSPNDNLNYKNLNFRRALQDAFSTPLANDVSSYRTLGRGTGYSIYSGMPNPRLVTHGQYTQSYDIEYDNAYIIRHSQNDYDQRWFNKSNLVRLSEFNNAPYKNPHFALTGSRDIKGYAPLTSSYYKEDETQTLAHSEEVTSSSPFGGAVSKTDVRIDFLGTNIVVNRTVDLDTNLIDPTANNYINPLLGGSRGVIHEHKKLHYYLLNSNGPYEHPNWKMMQISGPTHAYKVINSETYKNTLSVQISEEFGDEENIKIKTSPLCCKGQGNNAIVEDDEGLLHSLNYELTYSPVAEYYSVGSSALRTLPSEYLQDPMQMPHNEIYKNLFSEQAQEVNEFKIKYFDYGEQIYPRKQLSVQYLENYDTSVEYPQSVDRRKVQLTNSSLDMPLPTHAYFVDCKFSSWPVETFPIITDYGNSITIHDGELMQINHQQAYIAYANIGNGPYFIATPQYRHLTLGYKINHQNRPDSVSPLNNEQKPYKIYQELATEDFSNNPCFGAVAEFRIEEGIGRYLDDGTQISSSLSLFGYDTDVHGKELLANASYTDRIFELKDIHKQIDKF